MVFSSLLFLFRFLPAILIIYFAAPRRLRNGVLFIGSLIFYGWGEPLYISLLLFSTVLDYSNGILIERCKIRGKKKAAGIFLFFSAAVNLGLLCFFKYSGVPLPVGISFYTFQTMSYTIDVYMGNAGVQKNIVDFGAYVSMFPQLIAGPIVRYHTIADELRNRKESFEQFALGIRYFVLGLGKKVLLANNIGLLWEEVKRAPVTERTVVMVWLGIFAFGMQIYFDFSGYSDMASGLGHMFGFHFPENFRYPYRAASITDFWRRWHISLGRWFKEYVYIPLGGNKRGTCIQVRNIMIVWILTGIWHGAGWNFLTWGVYFGVWLLLEKFVLKSWLERLPPAVQNLYAMTLVFSGWVIFSHDSMAEVLSYLSQMYFGSGISFFSKRTMYMIISGLPLTAACIAGASEYPAKWCKKRFDGNFFAENIFTVTLIILVTAYLVDAGYNPFLYFRF